MIENQKKNTEGFGIASMVLGIISLLLFCTCINWITAILAIIFGILQMIRCREKTFAVAGIITAALSLLFAIVLYISLAAGMTQSGISYDDLYDNYYNFYDDSYYDNDYYDDYDYYYNDEENGQEFLNAIGR